MIKAQQHTKKKKESIQVYWM